MNIDLLSTNQDALKLWHLVPCSQKIGKLASSLISALLHRKSFSSEGFAAITLSKSRILILVESQNSYTIITFFDDKSNSIWQPLHDGQWIHLRLFPVATSNIWIVPSQLTHKTYCEFISTSKAFTAVLVSQVPNNSPVNGSKTLIPDYFQADPLKSKSPSQLNLTMLIFLQEV